MGNVPSCIQPLDNKKRLRLQRTNLLDLAKLNSTSLLVILDFLSWIDLLHLMQVCRGLNIYIKSVYAAQIQTIDVAEILLLAACRKIKLPGRWDIFYDRATAVNLCAIYATKLSEKSYGQFTDSLTQCLRSILRHFGSHITTICSECIYKHLGPFQLVLQPHFVIDIIRLIEEYVSDNVENLILPGKLLFPEIHWRTIGHFSNLKQLKMTLSEESEIGIEEMFEKLNNLEILRISSLADEYPTLSWVPSLRKFRFTELDFKLHWDQNISKLIEHLLISNNDCLKSLKLYQLQGSEDLKWLPAVLPTLNNLETLHLGGMSGSEASSKTFCEALQKSKMVAQQLKSLHLHGKYVTGRSISAICESAEGLEHLGLTRGFTKGYEGFKGADELMQLKKFSSVKRLSLDFVQSLSETTATQFVQHMEGSIESLNLVCLYRLSTKVWTEIFKLRCLKSLTFECVMAGNENASSEYISKVITSMIDVRKEVEDRATLVVKIGPHVDVAIDIEVPKLGRIEGVKICRNISNMKIIIA